MIEDRKYTDRDVRNHPDLGEVVTEYLEAYTGEFEFLIDMRIRALGGHGLTTGMVRGVLNCMRNDPRVRDLPEPIATDDENVISMYRKGRRRREPESEFIQETCPDMGTEHNIHWFPLQTRAGKQHCLGWHAITREISYTRARFHSNYLRGTSSNLIHRSTHEGSLTWFPPFHAYGPAGIVFWYVKPVCPLAALKNPSLLDVDGVRSAEAYTAPTVSTKYKEITLCTRCFPSI